ncbi:MULTISPECIES: GumC family protein [Rhizobium/Agrobacterium group]|uniref:GumC family protein n=1 Tax=Rhizobium/Agrobacterium group TaxID=227290 RepID=UPI000AB57F32|nr:MULTISPECIES: GumC family protein [Rhizobium/Agrobacterium group]NSX98796.1 GumC family protein [Agrobacterium vitis]NSZ29935.1 GumC family protein [Agrobacterium vitis]UJL78415.1 GumC family protein [Agrobacterium vitis]UJL83626.1 GumC family protein [Agrobacterium vitis]
MDIDIFQIPRILRRRWYFLAFFAVLFAGLALLYALSLKPVYVSSTQILLDPRGLSATSSDSRQPAAAVQSDPASLDSQIYVVLSSAVLGEVVNRLDLTKDPYLYAGKPGSAASPAEVMAATIGGLVRHVKVEREGQSFIMSITVEHRIAKTAADIANMIATVYLKQVDEARSDAARRASAAFQAQASELRDRVLKAERAVEEFRSANGLASTGVTGLVIDQQLAGLNQQLIAARGAEEQQQAIYQQTRNLTVAAVENGNIPEAVQSTTVGLLRDRYVQLQDRQAEASANLGGNHPQLKAINSQVASMRQAIQQELDRVRQSMKLSYDRAVANRKALETQLQSLTKTSFDSGARQITLRQLESEAEAIRTIYKAFLNRAEELSQEQTISINNSRVITEAVVTAKSVTTLKVMILAAAILFGLAFGSTLAVVLELLSRKNVDATHQDRIAPQASLIAPADAAPHPTKAEAPSVPPARQIALIADATEPKKRRSRNPFGFITAFGRRLVSPLVPANTPQPAAGGAWSHAIASTAGFLIECGEGYAYLTVLFVAAGRPVASAFIGDVAQKLADRDRGVLLANGTMLDHRLAIRSHRKTNARPSLAQALQQPDLEDAPLSHILRYERIALPHNQPARPAAGASASSGRPTYSRFVEQSLQAETDFTLINACGAGFNASGVGGEQHLTALAAEADVILVLTTAQDEAAALDELLTRLGEDAERVVGRIIAETAG